MIAEEFIAQAERLEAVVPDVIVDVMNPYHGSPSCRYQRAKLQLVVIVLPRLLKWTHTWRQVIHWLRRGSPAVWVVYLACRNVTIHRPDQLPQVLEENDELAGAPAFPDLCCRVGDLFFSPEQ